MSILCKSSLLIYKENAIIIKRQKVYMKYINKYLEYLKVVKKYSDKTIESYYDDLTLYNEFLGNTFSSFKYVQRLTILLINSSLDDF